MSGQRRLESLVSFHFSLADLVEKTEARELFLELEDDWSLGEICENLGMEGAETAIYSQVRG